MKAGWEVKPLSSLCERVSVGHVGPTSTHYCDDGVPFLRTQNIGEQGLQLEDYKRVTPEFHASLKKSQLKQGDLLLGRVVTDVMKCGIVPAELGEANCANMILIRPKEGLLPEFLNYMIKSPSAQDYLLGKRVGSAQQVVNTGILKAWEVPNVPLEEQKRIVAVLDAAFEGLTRAKQNAEANLQNARELFESYLNAAISSAVDEYGSAEVSSFTETIIDCVNKTAPKVDYQTPYKMVRTTNVRNGRVSLESVNYVDQATYEKWTVRQVPKRGDVLLTREAPMGEAGIILSDDLVFLGQRVVSYRVDPAKMTPEFLLFSFLSRFLNDQFIALGSGSTVQHIRVPHTKTLLVPNVPFAAQQSLTASLSIIREHAEFLEMKYRSKLQDIADLRQSLLQKAFSGALT